MEKKRNVYIIGGIIALIGIGYLAYKKFGNSNDDNLEEPKGEGDVSAKSKTQNKIVFTRNK
jgi:uncharacterized membrane protein YebE (DUF533 family)